MTQVDFTEGVSEEVGVYFLYDMNFSYTPIPVYTTQGLVVAQNVRTKAQRCMLGGAEKIKKKMFKNKMKKCGI